MNIITKGYGQEGGIITRGYGFWGRIKKKLEEALSRLIPQGKRRKFLMKVPVVGDLIAPVVMDMPVTGRAVEFKQLAIALEDEKHPFEEIYDALRNNDQAYLKELLRRLRKDEE